MKWTSISICFVLTWKIEFRAREIVEILSHKNNGVEGRNKFNFVTSEQSQYNSVVVFAKRLYLTLVDDYQSFVAS